MKRFIQIAFYTFLLLLQVKLFAQSTSPSPYCTVSYNQGPCNQPGPSNSPTNFVNDFIDDFSTSGALTNISNLNSGCNGGPGNYMNYCSHYLAVTPGQTIACTLQSGITYQQGFAIFIDWNQDNIFNVPSELVAATGGVPPAATPTTISFVVPLTQPNGVYRMRVRCQFASNGNSIPPCAAGSYGEVEDYTIYVGPIPPNSAVPTGTALVNTPICVGQALNFSLSTTYIAALSFTWTGPGSYSSTLQNPTIYNANTTASGVYTVIVSNSLCPMTTTVSARVVAYPNFTVSPANYTICQGGNLIATASLTTNPAQYTYNWTTTSPGLIFNPGLQSTLIQPGLLPVNVSLANIIYSITVTPTLNTACAVTQTLGVTINNPLTPTLTMPQPICDVSPATQLTASPGGGTWTANPAVSLNGSFNPSLAVIGTNTVLYSVSVGTCVVSNTGTLSVSRFHTPALSSTISTRCVQDPLFNLMNIVQDTVTGYWQGTQVTNNLFNAAGLPSGSYTLTHFTFSTPNPSVCPSSTSLVVPVFNPPIPVINSYTPICDNTPTMALIATPPNGVWSGNPGVSQSGIRTPSLNSPGTNTVIYTVGLGTCVASSSQTFHVSHYNPATLTGTVQHLCDNSNPVNLMSIVQNTNGLWNGVGIYPTTPNFFNPNLPTGIYTLTYTTHSTPTPAPVSGLCDAHQTLAISVLARVTPTITSSGPYCSAGSPVQLTVTPALGSWVTSPYLTSGGIFTPSLAIVGNSYVQYVIGTSTCNASQTKIIQIEAFVSAAIIAQVDVQCTTSPPINLVPFTQNNSGSWTGPGLIGPNFNPATTGAGNFILTYHTASFPGGLCPDQATLAVQVFSLAAPVITKTSTFCNNALPLQLQVSPVGGLFGSALPGVVSPGGLFNPALAAIGDNYITYTISVGPCKSNAQTKITIEKFVSAELGKSPDPAYCKNQLPFNLNSFAENPGGDWTNVQGAGVTGNMFDPSKANIGDGNIVRYTTYSSLENKLLCPDESTLQIRIKDILPIKPTMSSNGTCLPVQITLNTPETNQGQWIWNITDGSECTGLGATHIFTTSGTFTVQLTYMDAEAKSCSTQVVLPPITINPSPKADFSVSPDEITISDPLVTLTNLSTVYTENKYIWNIQGHDTLYDLSPKVKFTLPGSYKITLTATNLYDCKDQTSKTIDVKNDFNVQIPNSFTPNFDGLNDVFAPVFTPYGLDTRTFEMEIFDRWGRQVYHSWDVAKGWDGSVGGEIAKEDSYVYRIRFKDLEGRVYSKTGHLTLLRN